MKRFLLPVFIAGAIIVSIGLDNLTGFSSSASEHVKTKPKQKRASLSLASAGDGTAAGTATGTAPSSTWIAVDVPFTGDANQNGYTLFEIGTSSSGPFSSTGAD